jgi:hypothetical protein
MDKWYQSLHAPEGADAPRVRVVLWDAIKALEHVHYHRIVHCDVKLANVLVELGPDGQHRGILADFDLSKDLEARRQASVSVMSFAGPRGTLGCLTMAPEVSQGAPPDDKADVFGFGGIVLQVLFSQQAEKWRECKDSERWDRTSGTALLTMVQDSAAQRLLSQMLHRDKGRRPTSAQVVSDGFFSADRRALDLLQSLEQGREVLERQQADYTTTLEQHQQRIEEESRGIHAARGALQQEIKHRQTQLAQQNLELERKKSEYAQTGKRNQDVQEKLNIETKRLESEREKMAAEKRRREQDVQKQIVLHAQKKRHEEVMLASERKKIDDRKKELERKEKQASCTVRVPMYWKNKMGFHRVTSTFARAPLEKFMVESSVCCPATKKTKVLSVERIENENLWQMYQTRKDMLRKMVLARAPSVRKLSAVTRWQPVLTGSVADLSADVNEFYLFHGTSSRMASVIAEHGFDERMAALTGLYGAGSYFASSACKSHQYSQAHKDSSDFVMLVCRVTMGEPYCTAGRHGNQRRPPDNPATPGRPFDSIFAENGIANAGAQQHNEYVVFDRLQVYPEFIVRYGV